MAGAADGSDLLAAFDDYREIVRAMSVPTSQRTGRILLTRGELEALRQDLAAAGSDLTPEEVVDLMARGYGFRDGRLELYEDGSPIEA